jgi:Tfp pilus assembly protein PilV
MERLQGQLDAGLTGTVLKGREMRARLRIQDESGSLLIDLLVAMTIMVIAVGAILSAYAAGYISLRNASTQGNALTLADKQIELYNTLPNASLKLDASTIPASGSDPYVTAHSSDSTIPSSSGQMTGGTATAGSCTSPTTPQPACAVQTVTGPDGRPYRVDTYIVSVTPNASYPSRIDQSVTVVVRTNDGGTPGSIAARTSSVYDPCNPPSATNATSC